MSPRVRAGRPRSSVIAYLKALKPFSEPGSRGPSGSRCLPGPCPRPAVNPVFGLATEFAAFLQLFCSPEGQPHLPLQETNSTFQRPEDSSASHGLESNPEQAGCQPRDSHSVFNKCLIKIDRYHFSSTCCVHAGTVLRVLGILLYPILLNSRAVILFSSFSGGGSQARGEEGVRTAGEPQATQLAPLG